MGCSGRFTARTWTAAGYYFSTHPRTPPFVGASPIEPSSRPSDVGLDEYRRRTWSWVAATRSLAGAFLLSLQDWAGKDAPDHRCGRVVEEMLPREPFGAG